MFVCWCMLECRIAIEVHVREISNIFIRPAKSGDRQSHKLSKKVTASTQRPANQTGIQKLRQIWCCFGRSANTFDWKHEKRINRVNFIYSVKVPAKRWVQGIVFKACRSRLHALHGARTKEYILRIAVAIAIGGENISHGSINRGRLFVHSTCLRKA